MIFISILFGLLGLLAQWLLRKHQSGVPLTDAEKRQVNHALALMDKVRGPATAMGCAPQIDPTEPQEDHHAMLATAPGIVGNILTDKFYDVVVSQIILPKIKTKLPPGLLVNDEVAFSAFLVTVIKE